MSRSTRSLERNLDARNARGRLRDFRQTLPATFTGLGELFRESLVKRTDWVCQEGYHRRQLELARVHLAHGDYLRAAIFGTEAFISLKTQEAGQDPA